MFNQKNKEIEKENIVYVFIDASNLWGALKAKGRFLNFEKTIKKAQCFTELCCF